MGYKPGSGTVEGTDVLSTGEGGGRIKYAILVAPLIKAIQELTERVKELEEK